MLEDYRIDEAHCRIVYAGRPQPVAWIARDLGGHRQNVQRIVNDLYHEGFVDLQPNPHHKRAQLVVLTEAGRKVFDQAMQRWTPWANSLAEGQTSADVLTMGAIVKAMRRRLEASQDLDD